MIQINATQAIKDLRKEFIDLTGYEFNLGVARAINHTLAKSKTASSKEIRKTYAVSAKDVGKHFLVNKATQRKTYGMLIAMGRPLPLQAFNPRQTKQGVSILIKKGKRQIVKNAFLAGMQSGHQGVFGRGKYNGKAFEFRNKRTRAAGGYKMVNGRWQPNTNDLAINELSTISIPKAFSMPQVIDPVTKDMAINVTQRAIHELTRIRG